MLQSTATLSARLGLYSKTCSLVTPNHTGNKKSSFSMSSRVKMELNSTFVHPVLPKNWGERTRTHFLHSFKPFSMDSRSLSPTFRENSSYQIGHISFESPIAIGRATSALSRESWQIKASGFSNLERSIA